LSGNIDRIEAQRDMRTLSLMASSHTSEAATQHRQRLEVEAGEIVKVPVQAIAAQHAERDEQGFDELRALSKEIRWS
jgi:hypothetical protein